LWIYLGEQLQIRIVKSTVVGSKEQGQLKRKVYNAQLCRLHESRSLKVLEQHRHWSKEGTAARQKKKRSAKSMSFCVPEWGTRSGGMLDAVTPANDYPQLAPKGRGDSIRHQKAHLPDLASV
jgi:hypothetical protein